MSWVLQSLMAILQVRRIKTFRALTKSRSPSTAITPSASSSSLSGMVKPSAMVRPAAPASPLTVSQRISTALLGGEKGSSLPDYARGVGIRVKSDKVKELSKGEGVDKEEGV